MKKYIVLLLTLVLIFSGSLPGLAAYIIKSKKIPVVFNPLSTAISPENELAPEPAPGHGHGGHSHHSHHSHHSGGHSHHSYGREHTHHYSGHYHYYHEHHLAYHSRGYGVNYAGWSIFFDILGIIPIGIFSLLGVIYGALGIRQNIHRRLARTGEMIGIIELILFFTLLGLVIAGIIIL
jgi:hypothetical protein